MKLELYELDKPTLLRYVTEEAIFCRYLEISEVEFSKQYKNVLRTDNNAGCTFFIRDTDNKLMFNDWSKNWKADCFDVVMAKHGCNFAQAVHKVAVDFNIVKGTSSLRTVKQVVFPVKKPLTLRVQVRDFLPAELKFWSIGGFTVTQQLLQQNKIFSLTALWELRGETIENYLNSLKMTFMYKYPGKFKYQIYRPEISRARRRFINAPKILYGDLEFLNKEENYVVITKSKKDAFYLRLLGVNVFFVITEQINLTPDVLHELKETYEYIFTLFDNDSTGKRRSVFYKWTYGTIPLLYTKDLGKDTTEVLNLYEKQFMFDLIDRIKRFYYL